MKRKLLSTLILIATVISLLTPLFSVISYADETTGFVPSELKRVRYVATNVIPTVPKTFEATVKIPESYSTACAIVSSYVNAAIRSFELSINANGNPCVTMVDAAQKKHVVIFDEVDLRTNAWEHVSVVIDEGAESVHCYVGGELKSTKSASLPVDTVIENPVMVGGNYFSTKFFAGEILDVALFSKARSATEIASDAASAPSGDALLCYYDFSSINNESHPETVRDLSQNENHLSIFEEFYSDPVIPLDEYAYSFALVGDIQIVNRYTPENLDIIYDWLLKNKDDKKIAFAFNLGDITDRSTDAEWENAKSSLHKLDGIIPYSIIRGNHDEIADYKKAFPYSDYTELVDGVYNDNMLNSYQTFEVAGNKYLVLNLDFRNTYNSIEWADQVVATHHDYNVIVTSHMFIGSDGEHIDAEDSLAPTSFGAAYNCDELWDVFISKHKNIFMVISGHVSSDTILTTKKVGDNGNTVTKILVDPQGLDRTFKDQGALGVVAMLYFSADGKSVQTQFYSTIQDKYYLTQNEYRITLDPIQSNGSPIPEYHTYSLKYDETGHWEGCACGDTRNFSAHDITWTILIEATEEKSGRRRAECACGFKKIEAYDYEPPITNDDKDQLYLTPIIISVSASVAVVFVGAITATVIIKKKKQAK